MLCILLGAGYAVALYFRERKHEIAAWLRWVLAIFRGLVVSVLAFLLLSPLFKTTVRNTEPPIIVMAQDNSGSLIIHKDSVLQKNELPVALDDLAVDLGEKYAVERYTFGEEVTKLSAGNNFSTSLDYSEKRTNMAIPLRSVREAYENRNVGALIIGTDGIYNTGFNPLYVFGQSEYPVYIIAQGDTSVQKDLMVKDVRYNRLAYLDNRFPVEVSVSANQLKGNSGLLQIRSDEKLLTSQPFTIDDEAWVQTFNFVLEAGETGLQRYVISVSPLNGEISTLNNSKSIFIEVLDTRSKVLIIARAPHPDISAIQEAIRSNLNYEVENTLLAEMDKEVESYNLVILHQVPARDAAAEALMDLLRVKKIPYLAVLGAQSSIPGFNTLRTGVQLQAAGSEFQESLPVVDRNFSLFTLSDHLLNTIPQLPPLIVPFGTYQMGNNVVTLFNQRIGVLSTRQPLVYFGRDLDRKWGVIMGTGIWQWRVMSFNRSGDHTAFNELLVKMVQYLSLKDDRSRFRIFHDRSFYENQPVVFDAEVYNESYELISSPDARIVLRDEQGNQFPFSLLKKENSYTLNAGNLNPGRYTYQAQVEVSDTIMKVEGAFTVNELNIEMLNLTADHNLLTNLAERNGGKVYYPEQIGLLEADLMSREDLKPLVYVQDKFLPLIDMYWILILLFVLLSAEWLIRRRQGAY